MQLLSKVIRLDLQYSSLQSHIFERQICYLAPFQQEEALHFSKRILAYLCLFEWHPQVVTQNLVGKFPDLYLRDEQQHFQLWCQVDLPKQKHLQRASHQADQVLLVLDSQEQKRAQMLSKGLTNVRFFYLSQQQLNDFCDMLKGHMSLSVWREDHQLMMTDGEHQLEIQLAPFVVPQFTH